MRNQTSQGYKKEKLPLKQNQEFKASQGSVRSFKNSHGFTHSDNTPTPTRPNLLIVPWAKHTQTITIGIQKLSIISATK